MQLKRVGVINRMRDVDDDFYYGVSWDHAYRPHGGEIVFTFTGLGDVEKAVEVFNHADFLSRARVHNTEPIRNDHDIAMLINDIRDIAVKYGQAQQLRARLADALIPHLKHATELQFRIDSLEK